MSKIKTFTLFCFLSGAWFFFSSGISSIDRMMLQMESQALHRGKVVRIIAELYYQAVDGRLVTNYVIPDGKVIIANRKGEVTIYDKKNNSVRYLQGAQYSTEASLIHSFLQGKTTDLGLGEFGFLLTNTEFKDGLVITEWLPPASLYHIFSRIKLVHQDFLPVYAAYYDARNNMVKKVYYSDYKHILDVSVPTRITEFQFLGTDSIISRIRFSDIKVNHNARSPWFNFEVPPDAKQIH